MKGPEINNPTIDQVQPGMMVRLRDNSGIVIVEVNRKNELVLVGHHLGGEWEKYTWSPISQVKVVWSIGSLSEAMERIEQFNGAVRKQLGLPRKTEKPTIQ